MWTLSSNGISRRPGATLIPLRPLAIAREGYGARSLAELHVRHDDIASVV